MAIFGSRISRFARATAAASAMLGMALILGACGGGDSGGGGGGPGYAPPPTARPTLTGLTTRIDASGGAGTVWIEAQMAS